MDEFVPQRTSAYISQNDLHIGEMTVRETLAFSARCQGVGAKYGQWDSIILGYYNEHVAFPIFLENRVLFFKLVCYEYAEILAELSRREKEANIKPDPDVDIFMKVKTYLAEKFRFMLYFFY